jgi:uncharacterized protein YxjI
MSESLPELLAQPQLMVKQTKEWVEIFIDWETSNKYIVMDTHGDQLAFIAERGGGFGAAIMRGIARSHRAFHIDVFTHSKDILLTLSRKFFWFFSDLEVRSPAGEHFGSVHRRFAIFHKRYDLRDQHGDVFASISSPFWRLWTFQLVGTDAKIAKKWGGVLREVFTDADTYMIDYGTRDWSEAERAVIFAAAISIDFDFFENNQGKRGLLTDD